MKITRRDILKLTGGSLVGMFFTPLPWKLLDDSSIWTQNWWLTPPLPRGTISSKFSHCALCPAGCSVQAKCVNNIPFGLTGVKDNPIHNGYLCAQGLAGHHLPNHPLRIEGAKKFSGKHETAILINSSQEEIIAAVAERIKNSKGITAILNQNPDRENTRIYNEFSKALANGLHISSPSQENELLSIIGAMCGVPSYDLGFDVEHTNLIVNFGTNLIDGFGAPGRMQKILSERKARNLKLIHIEPTKSHTAQSADIWIHLNAGREYLLAMTMINVMLYETAGTQHLYGLAQDFEKIKKLVKEFSPARTAKYIGISETEIRNLVSSISTAHSAIITASPDPGAGPFEQETMHAVALLNILSGNVGKPGGIVRRKFVDQQTVVKQWNEIPNNSISVLIIDPSETGYAIPWKIIEKKLQKDSVVVSFSPFLNSFSAHADFLLPSSAPYEAIEEITTPVDSAVHQFAVAAPIMSEKEFSIEPEEAVAAIASNLNIRFSALSKEELLRDKAKKIYELRRGNIFNPAENSLHSITEITSADDLWEKLLHGAVWIDEEQRGKTSFRYNFSKVRLLNFLQYENNNNVTNLKLIPVGLRGSISNASMSPIISKLYQEAELRPLSNTVLLNPRTADGLNIHSNERAILETKNGTMQVLVKTDATVQPNCLLVSIAPSANGSTKNENAVLEICDIHNDSSWRITNAILRKA